MSITLLYDSGPCYVLAKPAGLLTQAPPGIDSVEARMKDFLRAREQKEGNLYLGVPHRLDRPVSGAIVLARHARATRRLSEQFEARTVRKKYWACVSGSVMESEGVWRDFIRKIPGEARGEIVPADHPEAREAVLRYRTLGETPHGAWLEIELETGRMHQIRIQAAARGCPVLGDELYGAAIPFGEQHEDTRLRAIALHARVLAFSHPMTLEPVSVIAPLPENWSGLVDETATRT